jgi:hypothetical protein
VGCGRAAWPFLGVWPTGQMPRERL